MDPQTKNNKKSCPHKKTGLLFVIVLLLGLLIMNAVIFWQQYRMKSSQVAQSTASTKLADQFKGIYVEINQLKSEQDGLRKTVDNMTNQLNVLSQSDKRQWILQSVKMHLENAVWMAAYRQNKNSARLLLDAADQQLRSLNDVAFLPVRNAIGQSVAALALVPDVDKPGIIARLNGLGTAINALPFPGLQLDKAKKITTGDKKPVSSTWRNALSNTWQGLSKIVVVRHHEKPIAPLLSDAQKRNLNQHLSTLLAQAKFGVLARDKVTYQLALDEIIQLIHQNYEVESPKTKLALATLQALIKIDVAPTLPSLASPLEVFNTILNKAKEAQKKEVKKP